MSKTARSIVDYLNRVWPRAIRSNAGMRIWMATTDHVEIGDEVFTPTPLHYKSGSTPKGISLKLHLNV